MLKSEIYEAITEKIIAQLESSGSWQQLWSTKAPVSLNGHVYRGINRMILSGDHFSSNVYGTFQQIRANGGQVRKGEKSTLVVFWKRLEKTDPVTLKTEYKSFLRYFFVFNTEQATFDELGQKKIAKLSVNNDNPLSIPAEQILYGYRDAPRIIYNAKVEYPGYLPALDIIEIPPITSFDSAEAFYNVIFHEAGHSTMHPSRLNREDAMGNKFGDENYCKEELVAELCSAYLMNVAGFELQRNSPAYIRNYADHLRGDRRLIFWAASRAEKAAEYILGKPTFSIDDATEDCEAELTHA